jgi:SOS-response transcriptional repressor LexA
MPKISPLQQELIQTISRLPVERQLAVANFLKAMAVPKATSRDYVEIWGSVSSGGAVEEFSTRAEVQIPGHLIQSIKPHFAIQVADQSLIAAGIRNKDLLLIKQTTDRFEWLNQLCVVRVAAETVLRYWRECHGEVTLEAVSPDSQNFGPFAIHHLECLGVFTGVASPDAVPKRRAINGTR